MPDNRTAVDELTALVGKARAALSDATSGVAAPEAAGPFTGEAAGGRVRAEVGADGLVRSVEIDPVMYREPLPDLAAAARQAINAARDARPGRSDLAPLVATVRAAQDQARHRLEAIDHGIAQVAANVRTAREGARGWA